MGSRRIRTDAVQFIGPAADTMRVFASVNWTRLREKNVRKKCGLFVDTVWPFGFVQPLKANHLLLHTFHANRNMCAEHSTVRNSIGIYIIANGFSTHSHWPNTIGTQLDSVYKLQDTSTNIRKGRMHVHVRRTATTNATSKSEKRIEINALFPVIIMSCRHIDADYLFFCWIWTR